MNGDLLRWFPAAAAVLYVAWMTAGVAKRRKAVDWSAVRAPWTTYALFALLYANLVASAWERIARGGEAPWISWAGVGLILAKALVTVWCIRTLGAAYSYHLGGAHGGGLVTRGPYAWCRHPMYAARLLATAGIPLCFGAWGVLPLALAADAIAVALRVREEEIVLECRYGASYETYRRRVGSLSPLRSMTRRLAGLRRRGAGAGAPPGDGSDLIPLAPRSGEREA